MACVGWGAGRWLCGDCGEGPPPGRLTHAAGVGLGVNERDVRERGARCEVGSGRDGRGAGGGGGTRRRGEGTTQGSCRRRGGLAGRGERARFAAPQEDKG